jgi:Holliday junction DNA helicase RuvA
MFAYIKGILIKTHPTYVVVEVNNVGYAIFIPCRLLGELPLLGQMIQLFTTFVVRESSHALYGFLSHQERDVFEVLMNVAGIGPKLAMSLIGHLTFHELQSAVAHQDLPTLCRVPGVGKKTAERLIVELKDKLPTLPLPAAHLSIPVVDSKDQYAQDAVLALINLGYNQSAAQKAINQSLKDLPETADLALLITTALKNIRSLA